MCKSLHSPYLSGLYVHACNCARVCECACVCARACVHVHICINLQLFSVCSPIMSVELSTMKTKGMCGPEVRQTHIRTQKEDRHGERMRAAHLKTCSHAASVHILCKHRFRYGYGLVITDNQRLLPAHTRPTTLQGGYCDKETLLSETACKDGKADWTSVKGTLILTGNVFNPVTVFFPNMDIAKRTNPRDGTGQKEAAESFGICLLHPVSASQIQCTQNIAIASLFGHGCVSSEPTIY